MTIYCGVDFHARQQTICFCDTADGEARLKELRRGRDDVRGFYAQLAGEVVVGLLNWSADYSSGVIAATQPIEASCAAARQL